MKPRREKSKTCYCNMTEPFWLLIQEDVNPRNSEVQEQELEDKRVTDDIDSYKYSKSTLNIFNYLFSK